MKNLCVKIPLLCDLQDISIYAKTIKELCGKKTRRKTKNPSIFHMVGTFFVLIIGNKEPIKWIDVGNPMVMV
jgi:hypothetical protein